METQRELSNIEHKNQVKEALELIQEAMRSNKIYYAPTIEACMQQIVLISMSSGLSHDKFMEILKVMGKKYQKKWPSEKEMSKIWEKINGNLKISLD